MSNREMREAKKDIVKRVKDVKHFLNKRTFIIRPIHSSQQLQKEERKVEAQDKELSHQKRRLSIRIRPINMDRKWSPSHLEKKIKQAAMRMK